MPSIRQLPPSVINKIAAGEVIERPASVVKELLENSIDSGATRIEVSVSQGGSELIRISDNGHGIAHKQLPLAVASHATSKITDADDLFRVDTLGFRGEALASIAEISQLTLRSRTKDASAGYQYEVSGGTAEEAVPCGCPIGTTVEVRNLFFNTPVRRKFLKTTQTEMGHITEAVNRIALAYPNTHFTLRHNNREVLDLPIVETWRERIGTLFGSDIVESLIWVEGESNNASQEDGRHGSAADNDHVIQLDGYVAHPSLSRANTRMQYLLLNGRHIRDRALQHALSEAYRGLLMTGRNAIAFLRISMSPDLVDVNVHPSKLEVRFQDSGRIYSHVLGTLRTRFLNTNMTTTATRTPDHSAEADGGTKLTSEEEPNRNRSNWQSHLPSTDFTTSPQQQNLELPSQTNFPTTLATVPKETRYSIDEFPSTAHATTSNPGTATPSTDGQRIAENNFTRYGHSSVDGLVESPSPPADVSSTNALQVHNCYLITETREGMVIIDQHALHERVIYEQLRTKILSDNPETQRLLVPEPVHLTSAEAAIALDSQEVLNRLGIEIEPFGGDTILVTGYPAMLVNMNAAELLRQVVDLLMADGKSPERRDILDELLHMVSCKAAVKAGDRLSADEIQALLEQRHLVQDSHHCPHGRPTTLVFSREELDKQFKRV